MMTSNFFPVITLKIIYVIILYQITQVEHKKAKSLGKKTKFLIYLIKFIIYVIKNKS